MGAPKVLPGDQACVTGRIGVPDDPAFECGTVQSSNEDGAVVNFDHGVRWVQNDKLIPGAKRVGIYNTFTKVPDHILFSDASPKDRAHIALLRAKLEEKEIQMAEKLEPPKVGIYETLVRVPHYDQGMISGIKALQRIADKVDDFVKSISAFFD